MRTSADGCSRTFAVSWSGEYDRLMRSVADLYRSGALTATEDAAEVFVEGTANLVQQVNVQRENDTDRLRQLLKTLEEKARIVELLSSYVDTRQEAVRV